MNVTETKTYYSYCTLFDSNYLDKGIAMIRSIRKYNSQCRIYVLGMDEVCCSILRQMNFEHLTVITLKDFETPELIRARLNRSGGEYCWTCSAHLVWEVLTKFEETYCTYIDADMLFYSDPDILVDQMIQKGKHVQIVPHGIKNGFSGKMQLRQSGTYCVEFNTFDHSADSLEVLKLWCDQTLNSCADVDDGTQFGDQMYLENWPDRYSCVNILDHKGAGIAPWNINRYRLAPGSGERRYYYFDHGKEKCEPVFFHFHGVKFTEAQTVYISLYKRYWYVDRSVADSFYYDYLTTLSDIRKELRTRFHFDLDRAAAKKEAGSASARKHRFSGLLHGNVLENIAFRLINYCKIFLNGKKDTIDLEKYRPMREDLKI